MTRSFHRMLTVAVVFAVSVGGTAKAAGPTTVKLTPQNDSGESGTATLAEQGTKTKVVVGVTGAPKGVAQPLHVHKGTCAQLDPKPAYGLTTLADGKSETTIDVPLSTLEAGGFAINGHKSAQDVNTYVFCGNIAAK